VQTYIKNGIELHKGDIVFDVGANIGLFILPRFTKAVPSPLVAIVVMTVAAIVYWNVPPILSVPGVLKLNTIFFQ
jgi:MFS superfamily sulfate permease-like transporter